jgi:hypothetical protein
MKPRAGSAEVLPRAFSVPRVPCARSQSGALLSSALLPWLAGSPRPAERPRQLLLTVLRSQFAPAWSFQSP